MKSALGDRSWLPERFLRPRAVAVLSRLATTLALGAIAGMGTFMFLKGEFAPAVFEPWMAIALVSFAGVMNYTAIEGLSEGLAASMLVVFVGFVITYAAWVSPVVLGPYPPMVYEYLLTAMIGKALSGAIVVLPLAYYGGYFLALLSLGYYSS